MTLALPRLDTRGQVGFWRGGWRTGIVAAACPQTAGTANAGPDSSGWFPVDIATHNRQDGTHLLVLSGEVDLATADKIRDAGLRCVQSPHCGQLIVDLLDVTFIDSTGLGALVAVRNESEAAGKKLVLHRPDDNVARLLNLTGLDTVFTVETSAQLT